MNIKKLILEEIQLLNEGVRDLRKKYVNNGKFTEELFDWIIANDPSKTKKYAQWIFKIANAELQKASTAPPYTIENSSKYLKELILDKIRLFDDFVEKGKVKNKDINQYDLFGLYLELKDAETRLTKRELKEHIKANEIKVKDANDEFVVACPLTKKGMEYLGVNTKWCLTDSNKRFWFTYIYDFKSMPYVIIDLMEEDERSQLKRVAYMYDIKYQQIVSAWNTMDVNIIREYDDEYSFDVFHDRLEDSGIYILDYNHILDYYNLMKADKETQNEILSKNLDTTIDDKMNVEITFKRDEEYNLYAVFEYLYFGNGANQNDSEKLEEFREMVDSLPGDPYDVSNIINDDLEYTEPDLEDNYEDRESLRKLEHTPEGIRLIMDFPIGWGYCYDNLDNIKRLNEHGYTYLILRYFEEVFADVD